MPRATPKIREFAERLIAYETKGNESSVPGAPAVLEVLDKLGSHLSVAVGKAEIGALLSRALVLASDDFRWLRAVQKPDGSLEGLRELQAQVGPEEFAEGGSALLAHFLGLLATLIGASLVALWAREIWPQINREFPLCDEAAFKTAARRRSYHNGR